jgi:exocyst complex component 6
MTGLLCTFLYNDIGRFRSHIYLFYVVLISVHENTRNLGKIALLTTAKRQEMQKLAGNSKSVDSADSVITSSRSIDAIVKEENDAFDYDSKIDFKSLYEAIHINDVLGKKKEFKIEFEENRKVQLSNPFNSFY